MTGNGWIISAAGTLIVAAIIVITILRVRRHSQFWTILSTVIGVLALLASVLQVAAAVSPPDTPGTPDPTSSSNTTVVTTGPASPPIPGPSSPPDLPPTPYPSKFSGKQLLLSGLPGSTRTGDCGHIIWVDISRPSVSTDPPDAPSISFQAICDSTHIGLATADYANDHMGASLHGGNTAASCEDGIQERPIDDGDRMTKGDTVCAETDEYVAAITWTSGGVTTATLTITAWRRPS